KRRRGEDIVLQVPLRNRAGSMAKVHVGPEHVIPLSANPRRIIREWKVASGQMAERAATRSGWRRGIGPIGPVRDILPFAVTQVLIIRAEAALLPHDEQRRELVGNESAVLVEERLTVVVLLHRVTLEEEDRAVRVLEGTQLLWLYRRRLWVAIDCPNLAV